MVKYKTIYEVVVSSNNSLSLGMKLVGTISQVLEVAMHEYNFLRATILLIFPSISTKVA